MSEFWYHNGQHVLVGGFVVVALTAIVIVTSQCAYSQAPPASTGGKEGYQPGNTPGQHTSYSSNGQSYITVYPYATEETSANGDKYYSVHNAPSTQNDVPPGHEPET
jgi:hypothetical protein